MNTKKFLIAGSILSADLLNLEKDVKEALDEGVDVIHFDVMDYHFVPNMTFGPGFLKAMRKKFPNAVFDVHLMVSPVTENIVDDYANAGANWISFHPEACIHTERMLTHIKEMGIKAGLALKKMIEERNLKTLIEVDGGVKDNNIASIASYGADTFVVGSAFFGAADKKQALTALHKALEK